MRQLTAFIIAAILAAIITIIPGIGLGGLMYTFPWMMEPIFGIYLDGEPLTLALILMAGLVAFWGYLFIRLLYPVTCLLEPAPKQEANPITGNPYTYSPRDRVPGAGIADDPSVNAWAPPAWQSFSAPSRGLPPGPPPPPPPQPGRFGAPKTNWWDVLGVDRNAPFERVRSAYREAAQKYHPDTRFGGNAEEFIRCHDAWEKAQKERRRS